MWFRFSLRFYKGYRWDCNSWLSPSSFWFWVRFPLTLKRTIPMKRDGNTGGNVGWWLGGGRKVGAWLLAAHTAESPGGVAEALLSCCGKETSCHLSGTMRFIAMNLMSSHISFCPPPPPPPTPPKTHLQTQPRLWSIIQNNKTGMDIKIDINLNAFSKECFDQRSVRIWFRNFNFT